MVNEDEALLKSKRVHDWWAYEKKHGGPDLKCGDVFLSMSPGTWIGKLIARFQGKGKRNSQWSHGGIYIGNGMIAEATFPKGRVRSLYYYLDKKHIVHVFSPPWWTDAQREIIAQEAERLAPNKYDLLKFLREIINNFFERITWSERLQYGWRPLNRFHLDTDGERLLICTELIARAVFTATGERMTDGELGTARPIDVWRYLSLQKHVLPTLEAWRGRVVAFRPLKSRVD